MKTKIWAALIAVYIVWGSTYLGISYAVETIPPFLHAGFRFLIAGGILITWRILAGDQRPTKRQWKSALIVGTLLLVGGNGLIALAEINLPSGIAALIVATIPLFMVTLEAIRPGGAKPTKWQLIGLLIGFGGVVFLISPAEIGGPQNLNLISCGITLLAAFLWSLGSIYNINADLPESTLLFAGMEMLMGSIGLIIISAITGEISHFSFAQVSTTSWLGLIYLICFGSLIGFTSYAFLLRNAPISLISTYPFVNPVVAIFLGFLFRNEVITLRTGFAAITIILSIIMINFFDRRSRQRDQKKEQALVVD